MRIETNNPVMDARGVAGSRALVPVSDGSTDLATLKSPEKAPTALSPLGQLADRLHIRSMTPRQMVDMSMDLYVGGYVQWEEYAMLAFQPELHPDYDRTVGALTGEKAAPDRPRDFIAEWEERLAFEQRNGDDQDRLQQTIRIVTLFRKIERPTDVLA